MMLWIKLCLNGELYHGDVCFRIHQHKWHPDAMVKASGWIGASINPGMHDMDILLGMSVLKHVEFTQRGDTLILKPHE